MLKMPEVNCSFHINLSNCSGLLKYKHWVGGESCTTLIASETLNLGNFMHAEVDFIFPSSAKITIKPNLVYLFNETQDPCPDGFNQSPCYVVIRGSLPWFCFYLTFRMCSQFKFREILAAKCCLIYMRIIRRGPLNAHSRITEMQPLSALYHWGSSVLQENVIFCQELIHSTRGMWPALWFLAHTRIQKLEVAQSQVCLRPDGCNC